MIEIFASEKLKTLYPKIKRFVSEELIPLEPRLLGIPFTEAGKLLDEKRRIAKKNGLWTPYLPEDRGGCGLSMTEFAQIGELLGMTPFGHYCLNCQAPDIGNIELLDKHASPDLKEVFLKPLIDGRIRSCFSMTEPDFAGSNPVNMATTATLKEGKWTINGHKWFTSAADGASFAVVMAVTDPQASPHHRASMFVVPTDNPGFERVRNIPVMGEEGEGYHSHAEIKYCDCIVPQEYMIGKPGTGFLMAQERLGPGRIHHCMRWIGICERAFDLMCKRAVYRDMGDGSKLGHKQTVQNWIAESRAEINAAKLMVLHGAQTLDKRGSKEARQDISTIKFYVADVLTKVLDRAIQVHGALGITDDTMLAWWYRHERGARIYDGPDEVHKASLAKYILKHYGLK